MSDNVTPIRPQRKRLVLTPGDRRYHGMFGSCVCDRDYNPATDQWDVVVKTQPECRKHAREGQ